MKILSVLAFASIIVISILLNSCSCFLCSKQDNGVVPQAILDKTDNFIIQRTGKDFFERFIKPDFIKTKYSAPYYNMVYRFIMSDKSYVNVLITFSVDTLGNIVGNRDITGIPDCQNSDCSFSINEDSAIKIAKESGLPKGIKDWKISFIWDSKYNQYVWNILSTNSASGSSMGFRGNGKMIIIDANTGLVLSMNDWNVK